VLNPIARGTQANGTITGGNLNLSTTTSDTRTYATFGFPTSGKYYWELTNNNSGSKGQGIASVDANGDTYHVLYFGDGNKQVDGTNTSYGASYTTNDVIGVAVDIDNNQITFYKNGTSQGAISYTFSSRPTMFPYVRREASTDASYSFNFGQRPFSYTPPSGFKTLNTTNLPTPTIGATASTQANDYFNPVLYTGNGGSQSVTGVGFAPDFVWIKNRANGTRFHVLNDIIRGANRQLFSNVTNAEETDTTQLTAFNSDGFTVGNNANVNENTSGIVAWNWKANGTGVSNTAGSITSTVSANTTAGFSVVTYTGSGSAATVGHGLGVAPSMIIIKDRDNGTYDWNVYHASLSSPTTLKLYLNTTDAETNGGTNSGTWNSTAPTSTVFSLGTFLNVNKSGDRFVAYCFSQVAGYSAFGSFVGNGSTDGAFVFTGFRPAFVMLKASSTGGAGYNWGMFDNDRLGYNSAQRDLRANLSDAEGGDNNIIDFLSNGFKIRSTSGGFGGGSGVTYIYIAFAESPFKYALAR
jgi:hypothetical protein